MCLTRLDEIRERAAAATEGPWEIDEHDSTKFESIVSTANDAPWGWVEVARSLDPDAEFIAHARTDVPALLAAVQAVLDLHKPEKRWMLSEDDDRSWDSEDEAREWMDGDEPEGPLPFFEVCAECKRVEEGPCDGECILELGYRLCIWPCPTYRAVTAALGEPGEPA